jgi:uncharacterized membrane protein
MRSTPPRFPHRRRGALAAAAVLAAGVGLADPAMATAAPSPLPTASGRWVPIPGLVEARDINNRGEVLGYDRDHRAVVWSPRAGGHTTLIETPGFARVEDLTDDGTVVGYSSAVYGPEPYGPFVWRAERGVTFIPQPANHPMEVRAANDRGAAVGSFTFPRVDINRVDSHAFIWTETTGLRDIDADHPFSTAVAINDRGVVAGSYYADGSETPGAFRWSASNGFETLGTLGGDDVLPSAIDRRGVIAGTATAPDGADHVVIWAPGTGPRDLGTVGHGTTRVSRNDRGTIAGAYVTGPAGLRRAYRWTEHNGFEDLGHPDGAAFQDVAGINNQGVVAVTVGAEQLGVVSGQVHLWRPTASAR